MSDFFDDDRFAALLDLAGPEMATELAERLDDDLGQVSLILARPADRVVLHAQSHILISIAGTIGATRLHQLARSLNSRVLQMEPEEMDRDLAELRRVLDAVIARLRMTRAGS